MLAFCHDCIMEKGDIRLSDEDIKERLKPFTEGGRSTAWPSHKGEIHNPVADAFVSFLKTHIPALTLNQLDWFQTLAPVSGFRREKGDGRERSGDDSAHFRHDVTVTLDLADPKNDSGLADERAIVALVNPAALIIKHNKRPNEQSEGPVNKVS